MRKVRWLSMALLFFCIDVHALTGSQIVSAAETYQLYSESDEFAETMQGPTFKVGIFMGVVSGLTEQSILQGSICIEDGVEMEKVLDNVANYVVENSEMAIGPSALIVTLALHEHYACEE